MKPRLIAAIQTKLKNRRIRLEAVEHPKKGVMILIATKALATDFEGVKEVKRVNTFFTYEAARALQLGLTHILSKVHADTLEKAFIRKHKGKSK